MSTWTTRELVALATFGALWGVAEMTLGAVLHALNLPFAGLLMGAAGMLVALTAYALVPRRGAVLTVALVSALLKAFSVGSIVLSPMLAIVAEAVLAEAALALAGGRPRSAALALAGGCGVTWSAIHPFVSHGLLAGGQVIEIYRRAFAAAARLLHLDPAAVPVVLLVVIALHAAAGAGAGALAAGLARQLTRRLAAGPAGAVA